MNEQKPPEFSFQGWHKSSYSQGGANTDCVEVGHAVENWHKSSYSQGGANTSCVEVGRSATVIGVRDTKNRAAGPLAFPEAAWANFTTELRSTR